jgi:hypothetical protein
MRFAAVILLAASPAFAAPFVEVDQAIAGVSGTQAAPDLALAVNNNLVVEIAGGQVAIGFPGQLAMQTTTQFWAAAGITATPGEHRALFDVGSQRWFVSADDASHRYLAVSASDNPEGAWTAIALAPATATGLTVDANGVYLVGNKAGATDILVLPLADALAGNATAAVHLTAAEADLVPALNTDNTATEPAILVGRGTTSNGNTAIDVWTISWSGTVPAITGPTAIDVGAIFRDPPPTAIQPPGSPLLPTGGGRIRSAHAGGSSLIAIAATQIAGRAAAFAVTIDLGQHTALATDQISVADTDLVNPELAVDGESNVGIVVTQTSATTAPAILLTGKSSSFDQLAPFVLASEPSPISCAPAGNISAYAPHAAIAVDGFQTFWADTVLGSTGDCAFHTQPVEFVIQTENFADDFPPMDPIDREPDGGCCSASGGASSVVLGGLVLGLALVRRRSAR